MLAGFKRFIVKLILCALIVPIVLVVIFKFINPPFWGWELSRALFPPKGYPEQTHHQWVDLSKISKNRSEERRVGKEC